MVPTFVLAPDSFKESMTALQACHAMQNGLSKIFPEAVFIKVPMADGGEGTVDTLIATAQGQQVKCQVTGPLPAQKVESYFGLIDAGQTAVIEMAKANGIHLLTPAERNPLLTTTYGTGEMIRLALDLGVSRIIIGLGGSVTNDAGAGMAQALGVHFYDNNGHEVSLGGRELDRVKTIDWSRLDPRLKTTEIIIASDVNNPLTGAQGASYIFGPQKGATPDMVLQLDHNLSHFADIVEQQLNLRKREVPGAGAAGGLGFGLLVFTGARIQSGVELVIQETQLEKYIARADYIFTGEGRLDEQSCFGKTPVGVARLARQYGKPVIACAGSIGPQADTLYEEGFTAIFGILDQCSDIAAACQNGAINLERTCENIGRILKLAEKQGR